MLQKFPKIPQMEKYFSVKNHLHDLLFAFCMAIISLIISVNGYLQLPQRTHEIAAMQNLIEVDNLGHVANYAIGTFLHKFIPETYFHLRDFYIAQLLFFSITMFLLSYCLIRSFKSNGNGIYYVTSIVILFFSGLTLASNFHLTNIPSYLGIGVNLFNLYFSHRSVFYLLVFIGIIFYFNKKFILGSILLVLASLFHPSNGATAFLIFVTYLFLNAVYDAQDLKLKEIIKAGLILLAIPLALLIKIQNIGIDGISPFGAVTTNQEYISAMFADEIDDFSPIFLLFQQGINPNVLNFFFSITGLLIGLYFIKNSHAFQLIKIIISGLLVYGAGILIELIYLKTGLLEYPMMFLIHSQFGYRIFCFTGIAAFLLFSFCVSELINHSKLTITPKKILLINFMMVLFIFSSVGILNHNFWLKENLKLISSDSNHLEYTRANLYKDMLKNGYGYDHVQSHFIKDCQTPKIFDEEEMQNNFVAQFDELDSRLEIVDHIKSLKIDSLIVPPYLYCFRELLGNVNIFFQEHDDGNFMLGSKKIYDAFLPRMKALNFEYSSSHPQSEGTMSILLRNSYLDLKELDFKNIYDQFRNYRYILTEQGHELDFKKIYEDGLWIIYSL